MAPKFLLSKIIFENFIEYGLTIKEMSALLGISEQTVYIHPFYKLFVSFTWYI